MLSIKRICGEHFVAQSAAHVRSKAGSFDKHGVDAGGRNQVWLNINEFWRPDVSENQLIPQEIMFNCNECCALVMGWSETKEGSRRRLFQLYSIDHSESKHAFRHVVQILSQDCNQGCTGSWTHGGSDRNNSASGSVSIPHGDIPKVKGSGFVVATLLLNKKVEDNLPNRVSRGGAHSMRSRNFAGHRLFFPKHAFE